LTIPEALTLGRGHHYAGRLRDAERVYRSILERAPHEPEALRLFGVIAYQAGQFAMADEALRVEPRSAEAYSNLGLVLEALGKVTEAIDSYHQALTLAPCGSFGSCDGGIGRIPSG
jgi:Flp pilus assembly protein TadD